MSTETAPAELLAAYRRVEMEGPLRAALDEVARLRARADELDPR